VKIEFDPAKDTANIAKHGISLALAEQFDLTTAIARVDNRFDYGEAREIVIGYIAGRLHVMVYTLRNGIHRAISLRKANEREQKDYDDARKTARKPI
jgi:uncharacterized DUF497 family protein